MRSVFRGCMFAMVAGWVSAGTGMAQAQQLPPNFVVRDSIIETVARQVARNDGGMIALLGQIKQCANEAQAPRFGRPRADYCLTLDVLVSNIAAEHDKRMNAAPLPGLSPNETAQQLIRFMDAMGVPPALRAAEFGDISARTSARFQEAARLESMPALVFKGQADGGQGVLRVTRTGDRQFSLRMSVTGQRCAGSVEGYAEANGSQLDLVRTKDGNPCGLSVTLSGSTAIVREQNCTYYHGASCAFEGTLSRVQ